MHLATLIALILITVLVISLRLLFTFSYDTFIPWEMNFGIYLYISSLFIILLSREYYFQNAEKSDAKRVNYIFTPALISTVVAIIVLIFFEIPINTGFSDAPTGAWLVALVMFLIIIVFLISVFSIQVYLARYKYDHKKSIKSFPFNSLLKKTSIISIPLLISLISFTSYLTYSDYATAGMKYNYTSDSNINVMYKKARGHQDITYCDHIINVPKVSYSTERCYLEFFEQAEEIKELDKYDKKKKSTIQNYFAVYEKYKNQQCQKSSNPLLCEKILTDETHSILELSTRHKIIYEADSWTPKYLQIDGPSNVDQKILHDDLIKGLEKFTPSPIAFIKLTPTNKHNKAKTKVYIDIKKLANRAADLLVIEETIETRGKIIYKEQIERNRLAHRESKLKREREKLKLETEMRKKHNINPNLEVTVCKGSQYYTNPCLRPMCANGEFAYNVKYYGSYDGSVFSSIASSSSRRIRCTH